MSRSLPLLRVLANAVMFFFQRKEICEKAKQFTVIKNKKASCLKKNTADRSPKGLPIRGAFVKNDVGNR